VKLHGGIYSAHIRDEGRGVFEPVKQAIVVGERTAGAPARPAGPGGRKLTSSAREAAGLTR
jgi:hypothetical protein